MSFRDFVETALYYPDSGYYARPGNPIGMAADYATAPTLSPVFAFTVGRLFREFLSRSEGAVCSFVDIGCGDGALLRALSGAAGVSAVDTRAKFYGVDRSLSRTFSTEGITFVRTLDEIPRNGTHFLFSNELYDAFPFDRLVQRDEHIHELWVTERDGGLDWTEHEAAAPYEDYFAERGIELRDGQFADVSLEWGAFHADVAGFLEHGLIVTIDYGFEDRQLFDPRIRRFGTAASYSRQRVHRDLHANPGEQDLTAHVNFSDLRRAGESEGARTIFFDRLAKFLLASGASEHELFRPITEVETNDAVVLLDARDRARRLILPDGIGDEHRVLVQAKGVPLEGWSFQRKLF